ncbi:MAG: hypothetical protein LBT27_08775 [Prevotellaceae bacterium]|jgi:hypothetical protein|nr:hypothetical protein [Prevotellaceae bacterium]
MGFNLSGIVINKNYKENIEFVEKEFDWNLEFIEEIAFEVASENWKEEGLCDIYFSEHGTMIFLNMDMCIDSWSTQNDNVLTFALSETSMAFNLEYCEKKENLRSIMEVGGKKMSEEGDKLPVEETLSDISEIIWEQIGIVLGKSFWKIAPEEKAYRYKLLKKENVVIEEIAVSAKPESSKKWWQFWK